MKNKENSVKAQPDAYHHGNLREGLLQAAIKQLKENGVEKLSLRAISRDVGVSQSAPFRHFKDKNAVLVALATEGFLRLKASMEGVPPTKKVSKLSSTGMRYVEFAIKNPEVFKLMFGSSIEQADQYPELQEAGKSAYAVLERVVTEGVENGMYSPQPAEELAFAAWATVHGLAHIAIENKGPDIPEEEKIHLVKSTLNIFHDGAAFSK